MSKVPVFLFKIAVEFAAENVSEGSAECSRETSISMGLPQYTVSVCTDSILNLDITKIVFLTLFNIFSVFVSYFVKSDTFNLISTTYYSNIGNLSIFD